MGAGNIANKFCDAVKLIGNCEVAAVASKSMERAELFGKKNKIVNAYDSYEMMLQETKADCVYIAVTPDAHYDLCMLCLDYRIPVLCEKAMFLNSKQAETVFQRAKELGVFVMEAMWSRFLPAIRTSRQWMEEKRIGEAVFVDTAIGFCAPNDQENRYFNPKIGGGAAYDITVYAYELTTFLVDQEIEEYTIQTIWSDAGVDVSEQISIKYTNALASLQTSIVTGLEEKMVIYGKNGKIIIPKPHMAKEAFLYAGNGELICHYVDNETENGFVYEIKEVIECIQAGEIESKTVPHDLTLKCSKLFDRIIETKG